MDAGDTPIQIPTSFGMISDRCHAEACGDLNGGVPSVHSDTMSDIIIDERNHVRDLEVGLRKVRDVRTLRVMIVDDSDLNRRILRKLIERVIAAQTNSTDDNDNDDSGQAINLIISEHNDGVPALEAMSQSLRSNCPFDYVFMDNIMIEMNGPEAAQSMRSSGYRGYVIGVTGNVLAEDMDRFVKYGADFVLKKPVEQDQIRRAFGW